MGLKCPQHPAQTSVERPRGNVCRMKERNSISLTQNSVSTGSINQPSRQGLVLSLPTPKDIFTPSSTASENTGMLTVVWRGQCREDGKSAVFTLEGLYPSKFLFQECTLQT